MGTYQIQLMPGKKNQCVHLSNYIQELLLVSPAKIINIPLRHCWEEICIYI